MSATQQAVQNITLEADEDLSSSVSYIAKLSADGQAALCGNNELCIGVIQDNPDAAGKAVAVAISGLVLVVAGEAISIGDKVGCGAGGKAKTAVSTSHVLGVAFDAATDDLDQIRVLLRSIHLTA